VPIPGQPKSRPTRTLTFPCHSELQNKHGMLNHENLIFYNLIADWKYQFISIFAPAPIIGGYRFAARSAVT
jgi:hypothetical protein